jgi:hypothetical protein
MFECCRSLPNAALHAHLNGCVRDFAIKKAPGYRCIVLALPTHSKDVPNETCQTRAFCAITFQLRFHLQIDAFAWPHAPCEEHGSLVPAPGGSTSWMRCGAVQGAAMLADCFNAVNIL